MDFNEELKDKIVHSGTSLVGIVCKDGVVMAGDRKATLGGQIVADKNAEKVVQVNDYMVVSGTGIASDIDMLIKIVRAQLELKRIQTGKNPSIDEAANLLATISYNNIRQPAMIMFMAGMMIGGLDDKGNAKLFSVEPAGSVKSVTDYDANLSSGMPYILGLLERQYKKNMSVKEGINLAIEAIKSSSQRDTASGHGVDVFTITKEGIKKVVSQEVESVYKDIIAK